MTTQGPCFLTHHLSSFLLITTAAPNRPAVVARPGEVTMANGWHRRNPDSPAARARAKEYDSPQFKAARLAVKAQVDAGLAYCWRSNCRRLLIPGKWHLGHDDADRSIIRGGECASCNLRAAARKGNRISNAKRKAQRQGVTALRM